MIHEHLPSLARQFQAEARRRLSGSHRHMRASRFPVLIPSTTNFSPRSVASVDMTSSLASRAKISEALQCDGESEDSPLHVVKIAAG